MFYFYSITNTPEPKSLYDVFFNNWPKAVEPIVPLFYDSMTIACLGW